MKDLKIKLIFLTFFCFNSINSVCIQGGNCPNNQGICQADRCVCLKNFWTLNTQEQTNPITPITYCNYEKYSRFYLLIFEFFLPSSGHFLAGKYCFGIFKLLLLFIPIFSCLIGFCFYYNGEGYQRAKSKRIDNDYTRENGDPIEYHEQNDNNLHVANREQKNVDCSVYLSTIITFVSLTLFLIMHIIDIICYLFGFYNDGYGVPLV